MNIFIVNNSKEACGVYQYGKRFANIACKSLKYNFMYFEIDSEDELVSAIKRHNPKAIIYNYLGGTLPWVNPNLVQKYRENGIKQYSIIHNTQFTFFDYYLHQNPYHKDVDNYNFALARPLIEYQNRDYKKTNDTLQIGTFGFGLTCKHIPEICALINEQLFDKKVQINLHLTEAYYCPNVDTINSIEKECLDKITHDNIKLNITRNFLSDKEMLDFLYRNDLNVFFYEDYPFYNGISSSVDYALSVKKPIAICKSNMFSHIWDVDPSICVEDNSLISIINNGFTPLEEKYNSWTNDKFLNILESIIGKTTDDKIMNFNSDAKQDEFVANILNFKENGYCVDIGSYHSINSNNTYCFQEKGWTSISVEIDSRMNESYSTRKSGVHLNENALNIDYKKNFEEYGFPKSIDYLSLDVDTASTGVLKILPLNEYRFKVITIEHDGYLYGDTYRQEQRNILSSHGYQLVCSNVYVEQSGFDGKQCPFEDWWIDPSEFDINLIDKIKSENEYPSKIIQKFK